jgi:hypothetical protein
MAIDVVAAPNPIQLEAQRRQKPLQVGEAEIPPLDRLLV